MFCGPPSFGHQQAKRCHKPRLKLQICLKQGRNTPFRMCPCKCHLTMKPLARDGFGISQSLRWWTRPSSRLKISSTRTLSLWRLLWLRFGPLLPSLEHSRLWRREEDFELPIELGDVMGYHQVGSGTYNQVGLSINVSGIPLSTAFDDVDEMYPVPLTVDASLESTASYAH